MSDQQGSGYSDRFEVQPTVNNHFAWVRTRLALERTLMAYMRTAASLIGFGFAIVQFFDRLEQMPGVSTARYPDAARYLGLALILCGVMGIVVAVWDYRWAVRYLWSGGFATIAGTTREGLRTPLYAIAIALICVGLFAFFAVLLRFV